MNRPVRRSQAIAPFGIGAMVDFPGPVSLIHCGLDAWPFDQNNINHSEFRIPDEPRLASRLGVDFFVQPPDYRKTDFGGADDAVNLGLKLPFLRFPLWHSCPRCGRMFEAKYHHRSAPECTGPIGSGAEKGKTHSRRRAVQVRFVSACTNGHLRDFPFIQWLGLESAEWNGKREDRWLRMISTGSASISGVIVVAEQRNGEEIKEIARKTLAGAFNVEPDGSTTFSRLNIFCDGQNPALGLGDGGDDPMEPCGQHLRASLRGASNLYFGDVRSSIFIPEFEDSSISQEVLDLLEDYSFKQSIFNIALESDDGLLSSKSAGNLLRRLRSGSTVDAVELAKAVNKHALKEILTGNTLVASYLVQKAKLTDDRLISKDVLVSAIKEKEPGWAIDPEILLPSINEWLQRRGAIDSTTSTEPISDVGDATYRAEEYRAFCRDGQDGFPKANLLIRSRSMTDYSDLVSRNFSRVSLLDKLRETRAFVGFTRIYTNSTATQAERWKLISREQKNWLPAVVVRGEGIFLVFDSARLAEWDNRFGAIHRDRLRKVNKNLHEQAGRRHQHTDSATPKFVLLHTFAHVLISQLVFDCGYGSSSLRERIYCSDTHPQMSGVLIYTAAGDSEGTMGGLVRMGEPKFLERTIARALDRARWCSSDPVCIESSGQGPDSCNLAACHSCALLPETSCEQQNRLLDRGMLIGLLNNPEAGFFSQE
jgi:Domain of unknown function (DUF1998)